MSLERLPDTKSIYKINSIALHWNSQLENILENKVPFTIAIKTMKYLGINLKIRYRTLMR